jgi:hypothetical protein
MSETDKPEPKSTVEIPDWLRFRLEILARDYKLDIETVVATAVIKELAMLNDAFKQNQMDNF